MAMLLMTNDIQCITLQAFNAEDPQLLHGNILKYKHFRIKFK